LKWLGPVASSCKTCLYADGFKTSPIIVENGSGAGAVFSRDPGASAVYCAWRCACEDRTGFDAITS